MQAYGADMGVRESEISRVLEESFDLLLSSVHEARRQEVASPATRFSVIRAGRLKRNGRLTSFPHL